jgi:putative ABC transport system permease protein
MVSIAREILFHDKLRFFITVVSLGFAIVMTIYDLAMFFGVTSDSVALIDRAQAELWISKKEETHLNAPSTISHNALGRVLRREGVQQACALDISVGNLKIGDTHPVQVVGIDPACPLFQPWDVVAGEVSDLRRKDTVIVDDLALRGLSQSRLGEIVELNGEELSIVGITHGNKSFSSPFVYINLDTFEDLTGKLGLYNFVAVQLNPGADPGPVISSLIHADPDLAVTPASQFRQATILALVTQGVGMIFVIVFVGVLVGMLTITLTMYTATMELLRDFAILKALGATRRKIWGIVLEQAITQTAASFGIGLAASFGVNSMVEAASGISGQFPMLVMLACFLLMVTLAILGSLISIRKATRVDPAMVFRA